MTARIALGSVVLAVWSAGMLWLGGFGTTAAVVSGVLFTVPLCSLGEWVVHGVLYHRKIPGLEFIRVIHHNGHHRALFPPKHYVWAGPTEFMRFRKPYMPFVMSDNALDNALTKWSQVALHFVAGIPLIMAPAWLVTGSVPFVASAFATLCVISYLLAHVHGAIHTPRDRWVERRGWFKWLNQHHYIHHIDLTANMNFGLPLCDVLFGTLRLALTAEEAAGHPTFEEAKRLPPPPDLGSRSEVAAAT